MSTNVDDLIKKLSSAQREKVEARVAELIARETRKPTAVRVEPSGGVRGNDTVAPNA